MRREWIEMICLDTDGKYQNWSPSMRREWIEIDFVAIPIRRDLVSLHAEGVD